MGLISRWKNLEMTATNMDRIVCIILRILAMEKGTIWGIVWRRLGRISFLHRKRIFLIGILSWELLLFLISSWMGGIVKPDTTVRHKGMELLLIPILVIRMLIIINKARKLLYLMWICRICKRQGIIIEMDIDKQRYFGPIINITNIINNKKLYRKNKVTLIC